MVNKGCPGLLQRVKKMSILLAIQPCNTVIHLCFDNSLPQTLSGMKMVHFCEQCATFCPVHQYFRSQPPKCTCLILCYNKKSEKLTFSAFLTVHRIRTAIESLRKAEPRRPHARFWLLLSGPHPSEVHAVSDAQLAYRKKHCRRHHSQRKKILPSAGRDISRKMRQ